MILFKIFSPSFFFPSTPLNLFFFLLSLFSLFLLTSSIVSSFTADINIYFRNTPNISGILVRFNNLFNNNSKSINSSARLLNIYNILNKLFNNDFIYKLF